MLDVHPPQHSAHSWRDFFIHIITITIGLFIALMLEAGVEHLHNRHLLHTAQENLRTELSDNRKNLEFDRKQLDGSTQQFQQDIVLLEALKEHKTLPENFAIRWDWNSMQAAAWDTARDTGALSLMSYEDAHAYDTLYRQQQMVNEESAGYIRDVYRAEEPLQAGKRSFTDLSPAEIDAMISAIQQTLVDIQYLDDICDSLRRLYQSTGDNL